MHTINFLQATTPQQHQSLRHWYRITAVLSFLFLLTLGSLSGWQLYRLNKMRASRRVIQDKVAPFIPALEHKKQLQQELIDLIKKIAPIKQLGAKTEQTCAFLQTFCKACNPQIELHSIRLDNGLQEFIIGSPDLPTATAFLHRLQSENRTQGLYIAAFEPAEQHNLLITIKGSIHPQNKT